MIPVHPFEEILSLDIPASSFLEKVGSILRKIIDASSVALVYTEKRKLENSLHFPLDRHLWLSFTITPIKEEFFVAIHEGDLALLFSFFCCKQKESFMDESLFYPFIEAICYQFVKDGIENNLLQEGSLSFHGIESLPRWNSGESFHMVATFEEPQVVFPFLLVFPHSFIQEQNTLFQKRRVNLSESLFATLPIKASFSIGHSEVFLEELKTLQEGDFLVIDHLLLDLKSEKGMGIIHFEGNLSVHVRYKEGTLKIIEILHNKESEMSKKWSDEEEEFSLDDKNLELASFKDLALDVQIELDSFTYPLEKLLSLKEGSLIEGHSIHLNGPLFLVCRGKKFAEGELVQKEGHVLFRILKLHKQEEQSFHG